jgi:hypothetical protein
MSITTEQDNGILTLTRFKPDAAASVGLELAYAGGEDALEDSKASLQRVVGRVSPDGLFADTSHVLPGMLIESMNGLDIRQGFSPSLALGFLKRVKGHVTLTLAMPPMEDKEVTVTRIQRQGATNSGLGMFLDSFHHKQETLLKIVTIDSDSIFADSELEEGMTLLTINGLTLDGCTASEATGLAQRIKGEISLTAVRMRTMPTSDAAGNEDDDTSKDSSATNGLSQKVTVQVHKTGAKHEVGLALETQNGHMVITKIDPSGLLAGSDLESGMELLSVNNVLCQSLSARMVRSMMQRVSGDLHIVAERAASTSSGKLAKPPSISGIEPVGIEPVGSSTGPAVEVELTGPGRTLLIDGVPSSIPVSPASDKPSSVDWSLRPSNNRVYAQRPYTERRSARPKASPTALPPVPSRAASPPPRGAPPKTEPQPIPVSPPRRVSNPSFKIPQPSSPSRKPATTTSDGTLLVSAYRPSRSTKIGVQVVVQSDGQIVIEDVLQQGLFGGSELQKGMLVQSVNGIPCRGRSPEYVDKLIARAVGTLQIAARSE